MTGLPPHTALRLVEAVAAAGVLLGSLERLARPRELADSSLASWPVLRLRHPRYAFGLTGAALHPVVAYPAVLWLVAARAAAGACLLAPGTAPRPLHVALLSVVVASGAALGLRGAGGGEGSDQVLRIIFATLLLVALHPTAAVERLGLWFLALQACLAYFVSGIYKVTSRPWQDGTGLTGILSTRCYGHPGVATWLTAHPATTTWLSRGVSTAETLFPLILLAPAPLVPLALAAGALFHLACAAVMGLNCFVWAFTALYPAVAWAALGP
ncbi:hypothetical protein [Streptomyces sp. NPDC049585]|uniref:hypothetical protein n=1 Tax=Streptomyces sp. NPDC049585 TaxID=3155154 RepID=UPI003442D187